MKTISIAMLLSILVTGSAFAQDNSAASSNGSATMQQSAQWVPPYGDAIASKTRAEVGQELVHAEQDGQLAYLDRTVYGHH
jgi:Domain of unknown function (DUF4148)